MLDALKRVVNVKDLEDAFLSKRLRELAYFRSASAIGKVMCLLFFAVRYDSTSQNVGADNVEHLKEVETID